MLKSTVNPHFKADILKVVFPHLCHIFTQDEFASPTLTPLYFKALFTNEIMHMMTYKCLSHESFLYTFRQCIIKGFRGDLIGCC